MQTDAADDILTIWPSAGVPPGSETWTHLEQTTQVSDTPGPNHMTRNVVIPTLTVFKPAMANGTAIIIAPGGAFHFLMMDHEGCDVARWLTTFGVTTFVLKYRVQRTPDESRELTTFLEKLTKALPHPDHTEINPPVGTAGTEQARLWAEEDGRQAIRFLRQNASKLSIDANKIGIMGFSAGGGVAINAGLEHDGLSRPDFIGGIYAGYRHVNVIPENLPPLFLAIAADDEAVAATSSARLYELWRKTGQTVELHIFGNGRHGFGMREQRLLSDSWPYLFKHWLAAHGYISL